MSLLSSTNNSIFRRIPQANKGNQRLFISCVIIIKRLLHSSKAYLFFSIPAETI
ncbi:hypothetical protein AXX17_AT5G18010 [Arabidopsis thaliana]|uniref:Uncharacterized protein n=1 Tax=Arabidopsis thaliana TaxID=3702 RepID=A0A178UNA5_ARATH|nr:hypothetical protein AXX17_AT5G18010 [Arabidopsis thaliana]